MDTELLVFVMAVFLVAGLVKGVIGLGLPTVSLAVLTVAVNLPVAVLLMVIPSAVTNVWQAVDGPHTMALLRRFWTLLAASVACRSSQREAQEVEYEPVEEAEMGQMRNVATSNGVWSGGPNAPHLMYSLI